MKKYGGKCVKCGTSEIAVLTLDHVYNTGAAERRRQPLRGSNFYTHLLRVPRRRDLQVLCANCQLRKHFYEDEWPLTFLECGGILVYVGDIT